jgi:hypothetical protein
VKLGVGGLAAATGLMLAQPVHAGSHDWSEPKRLGSFRTWDGLDAGIGPNGYALVGWPRLRQEPASKRVVTSVAVRRREGRSWRTITVDDERSEGVRVGVAEGEETGVVAWRSLQEGIRAVVHSRDHGFDQIQTLSEGQVLGSPMLDVAPDGTAVIAWAELAGGDTKYLMAIREQGANFGSAISLEKNMSCGGVAAARGGAVAVGCDHHDWADDGGKKGVIVFRRRQQGEEIERVRVSGAAVDPDHALDAVWDLTVSDRGRVDLALSDSASDPFNVIAARTRAVDPFSGEFTTLSTGGPNYGNFIESDARGNLMAAWFRVAPYQARFSTRPDNGHSRADDPGWQPATIFGPADAAVSDLDVAPSGAAIAGLGARDSADAVRVGLGTVAGLTKVETVIADTDDHSDPAVARSSGGGAIAAWTEKVNGRRGVFVSSRR